MKLCPTYIDGDPQTEAAKHWQGWGTALKPAWEPVCVAQKPISEKNIASNVIKWGTGAMDIDGARIGEGGRWPANLILDEEAAAMLGKPSRFFFCPKASKSERGEGNAHPTVKPVALMEYLIKLVSREGSIILDPFSGSGTTVLAAVVTGRKCIGIEQKEEYCEMMKGRCRQVELGI